MISSEQRRFNRVAFSRGAWLEGKEVKLACEVIDLSLKGALLDLADKAIPADTSELTLTIDLIEEAEAPHIQMSIQLVEQKGSRLHCACQSIDLDSLTHLRRLVELNTGKPELLERELAHLCQSPDEAS